MQKLKAGTRAGVFFAAAARFIRFIRFIIELKGKEYFAFFDIFPFSGHTVSRILKKERGKT